MRVDLLHGADGSTASTRVFFLGNTKNPAHLRKPGIFSTGYFNIVKIS